MNITITIAGLEPLATSIVQLAAALEPKPGKSVTAPTPLSGVKAVSAPTEAAPEPSTPASPSKAPTVAEVRAAIKALSERDKDAAVALLKKFAAPSVSALKPEHYAAVLAEAAA